jgi:hypothetical protein
MKRLFYVIEKELQDIDGFEETTGRKTITCYSIVGDSMEKQFDIDSANDDNSIDMIDGYLVENGMGDTEFELIQL